MEPEKNVRQHVGNLSGQARTRGSDMSARNEVSQSAAAGEVQGGSMTQEKRSFWSKIFGSSHHSGRQAKVLEYIVYRIGEGAYLQDLIQEEYVRRNASADEVRDILENPKLVEAARQKLGEDFSSGDLDPR